MPVSSNSRRWWLLVALPLLAPAAAGALAFRADLSSMQIDAHPGEVVNRTFELRIEAGEPATQFAARVEDWWASEDGNSTFYRPAGSLPHSCGPWVELNPVEATVPLGGTLSVRLTTTIPRDAAAGGYWCVLTVDEQNNPLTAPAGVDLRFLASVSVGIFVYVPPIKRTARIVQVDVAAGRASVLLRNEGNAPIRVEGRFEFFRPGEKVPVAVAPLPRTPLLLDPAPTRRIATDLPPVAALPAGRYLVRAVIDVGVDHYLAAEKEMAIGVERTPRQPAP